MERTEKVQIFNNIPNIMGELTPNEWKVFCCVYNHWLYSTWKTGDKWMSFKGKYYVLQSNMPEKAIHSAVKSFVQIGITETQKMIDGTILLSFNSSKLNEISFKYYI